MIIEHADGVVTRIRAGRIVEEERMPKYFVVWAVDIDGEATPEAAARKAQEIQQRPGTSATVFEVITGRGDGWRVDLEETPVEVRRLPPDQLDALLAYAHTVTTINEQG